jgi:DNA repair exonuclease SbcCD ATPase subunit
MIKFKVVRWKNLLSTGNIFTEVVLDSHKTTLIMGANGNGKSTILDAISLALFGSAFRDINKPNLVNSITGKGTVVELEFEIGSRQFKVIRGIKPNVFEVYENGEMWKQDAASKDDQTRLEEVTKLNAKSFAQIVVLGLANYTPFMKLKTPERRKVIEDLLDLQIFSVMNSILKTEVTENKDAIVRNDYEINNVVSQIAMEKKHIQEMAVDNQKIIDSLNARIVTYQAENQQVQGDINVRLQQISGLTGQVADTSKQSLQVNQLTQLVGQFQSKKNVLSQEIAFYAQNSSCPQCKQSIDDAFKSATVEQKTDGLSKMEAAIAEASQAIASIRVTVEAVQKVQQEIAGLNSLNQQGMYKINTNNGMIASCQNDIGVIQTKLSAYQNDNKTIANLESQLETFQKRNVELLDDKEVLTYAAQLLKDGGIKAKIVKQYVPIINNLLNKYLEALDFCVQFEIDENFDEKILSRGRDDFTYDSFSQGEKLRIDLALLFTWRAIAKMRNSTNTNLLLLDEILDSSLDQNGVDDFLKLLKQLTQDTNTFIISHKDNMMDKFDKIITFEKNGNFSRIAA